MPTVAYMLKTSSINSAICTQYQGMMDIQS